MSKQTSRRDFIKTASLGGLLGGLSTLSQPVWSQNKQLNLPDSMQKVGSNFTNYGSPSEYEKTVIRWVSANSSASGNGVSWTPLHDLHGTITPNGLHYERHHNGVPNINPEQHELVIDGLVDRPLIFDLKSLHRYPMETRVCFIECGGNSNSGWRSNPIQTQAGYAHGLVSNAEWTGIPLKVLLNEAGIKPSAQWVIAEAADAGSLNVSIPLEKLLDEALLALYQNGERIRPENGYPLRLVIPGWEGIVNVKWLRQLRLTNQPAMTRDETAQYTELLPSGKADQFSFVMEAKSLITSPSLGMVLPEHGIYQISGLAWSGRGKISRVEISSDGGKTWQDAELQHPILSKAFTRFNFPWKWQGQYAVIQSRAIDETGYIQPTRSQLIAERGKHGFFHYNAIVSWEITEQGDINHVYDV
jgi:sulfane dehydrogenase subunit SoxC